MSLKQYFIPEKIASVKSKINKNVQIVNFGGHRRLDMGGLTQSGRIIEDIWKTAFKRLLPKGFVPDSVLILGFGGGSAAKLIHRLWPSASITGVDIDPAVISIAKKYFSVEKIPNLNIVNADAYDFIKETSSKDHWSLIIVDCYLGDQFPKKLEETSFYKKLSSSSDALLINRLFWGKYQPLTIDFLTKLEKLFSASTTRTASNFLIFLKKRLPPSRKPSLQPHKNRISVPA